MPAKAGTVDAVRSRGYEPGGASPHRLTGGPCRSEKRDIAEIAERKRIVPWHDAASMASNADPGALIIN